MSEPSMVKPPFNVYRYGPNEYEFYYRADVDAYIAAAKAQATDDLKDRHKLLQCWVAAGRHPNTDYNVFEFAKEIIALIERVSKAEAQLKTVLDREAQTCLRHNVRLDRLERERDKLRSWVATAPHLASCEYKVWVCQLPRCDETHGTPCTCGKDLLAGVLA